MRFKQRSGSTLVEALVGLALMAIVAMLATSGLGFGARVDEASREAGVDLAMDATLTRVLSTTLRAAEPWRAPKGSSGFDGDNARLEFVAADSARQLDASLNRIVFAIEPDGDAQRIMFERMPVLARGLYDEGDFAGGIEVAGLQRSVLFESDVKWRFRYFGSDDEEPPSWRDSWQEPTGRAPQLVMLEPTGQGATGRDRAIVIRIASRKIDYCQAFRTDEACRRLGVALSRRESQP